VGSLEIVFAGSDRRCEVGKRHARRGIDTQVRDERAPRRIEVGHRGRIGRVGDDGLQERAGGDHIHTRWTRHRARISLLRGCATA